MLKKLYQKNLLNHLKLIIKISCLILIGIIFFLVVYWCYFKKPVNNESKGDTSIVEEVGIEQSVEEVIDKEVYYYVDIKGAVANPNVYKVKTEARIIDVISLAGGLTSEADTSTLNLSKKVTDEMFVIIYTKGEIEQFKNKGVTTTEVIKYIESSCTCPDPSINNSCISNEADETNDSSLIKLNTATKDNLMTLPSIGETKALAIIEYRNSNGLFKSIEDIRNVNGIGDSTFAQIKSFITL